MATHAVDGEPVLVIGGGIGGLATALALARTGRRVEVFEQAEAFKEIGAGLQVGPNAFRVFAALGVTEAVRALATFPQALALRDLLHGGEITTLPLGPRFEQRYGFPYGLMHRADLLGVLLAACRETPQIRLRTGHRLVAFEDQGEGVLARFEDGALHRGAALVGADGLWSTVRQALVDDGPPRLSGHICYRAVVPTQRVPDTLRRHAMSLWLGPRTHMVLWPMRQAQFYNITAVFHSDRLEEGWDSEASPQELHERFAGALPEVRALLGSIDNWRMFVLRDRDPIRSWSKGRVTLLGDAAHPTLQYLAQGACMAMEDGVCLAEMLQRHGGDVPAALLRYQQARYLRTARVQLTSRLYGHVYHASGATADLRDQFLRSRSAEDTLEGMAWVFDPQPTTQE